jgi:hypothetical protein
MIIFSIQAADSEYYQELVKFQEQFWELRHKFHIQVAKGTKELRAQDGIDFLSTLSTAKEDCSFKQDRSYILTSFLRGTSTRTPNRKISCTFGLEQRVQYSSASTFAKISESSLSGPQNWKAYRYSLLWYITHSYISNKHTSVKPTP